MTAGERPPPDLRSTLPSEELPAACVASDLHLVAVIAFHPQVSRIGERWHESVRTADAVLTVGRDTPMFARCGTGPSGLGEQHISREAFTFLAGEQTWVLRRQPGSSRLRVNGQELVEEMLLSVAELRGGVVLTLGTRIVLHVRLQPVVVPKAVPEDLEMALPGVSAAAVELREAVLAAARSTGDVLLIGPTGSGKERVARAVHEYDDRKSKPWVAVNMAALPSDIAPASLFGVRKGAYTGADQHRSGYFQQAQGGTLFLDEIADAPAAVQPLLLRALQEREVQVVGGAVSQVTLRVIAAMEWDPDQETTGLRPALRYRLGAHEIRLPALAERKEDLGPLAVQFLCDLTPEDGSFWNPLAAVTELSASMDAEKPVTSTDPAAPQVAIARWALCFESLLMHDWPGNIRELKHVLGQVVAAGWEKPVLPERIRYGSSAPHAGGAVAEHEHSPAEPGIAEGIGEKRVAPASLAEVDDEAFLAAWIDAEFSPTTLARSLGVSRAAVYRRVQRTPACRLAGDVPLGELLAMLDECRGDLQKTAGKLAVSSRGLATRLRLSGIRSSADPISGNPPHKD